MVVLQCEGAFEGSAQPENPSRRHCPVPVGGYERSCTTSMKMEMFNVQQQGPACRPIHSTPK